MCTKLMLGNSYITKNSRKLKIKKENYLIIIPNSIFTIKNVFLLPKEFPQSLYFSILSLEVS